MENFRKRFQIEVIGQTVQEMMADRGYDKLESSQLKQPWMQFQKNEDDSNVCYVFLCSEPKMGVQEFRKVQNIIKKWNIQHCIIISQNGATPTTAQSLNELDSDILDIELFPFKYLMKNPTRHTSYVPHRALSLSEKAALLIQYHVTEEQLPVLYSDDRICQYFHFHIGTVVEISRTYGSLTPYKTYRIVKKKV
jgi:DNA-directed RNA polymerase subunit H (RpoH/RPB5)